MWLTFADPHPSYCAARWRNGVIAVWNGRVTVDALQKLDAFQPPRGAHASYYFVSVNPPGLPFPDSTARARARELIRKRDRDALHAITVLEGDGLFASAGRVVLSNLFTRANAKELVCANLTEAARALAPLVMPTGTVDDVRLALEVVRTESRKQRRGVDVTYSTSTQMS